MSDQFDFVSGSILDSSPFSHPITSHTRLSSGGSERSIDAYDNLKLQALDAAKRFHSCERALIQILQEIDQKKAFRVWGYSSLYDFATRALNLSEANAYAFISVARKALQVPELQKAILQEELTVSKAKRIVPVITQKSSSHWIEMASTLPKAKLEKKIAEVSPKQATVEKAKYVSSERLQLQVGVSEELMEKIRRVQDLESQRTRRAVSLEETLQIVIDAHLKRVDPLQIAKRAEVRAEKKSQSGGSSQSKSVRNSSQLGPGTKSGSTRADRPRIPIPAAIKHRVTQAFGSQCAHRAADGSRCSNRRWLDFHHLKPVAQGGTNALENLVLLCRAHHHALHEGRV